MENEIRKQFIFSFKSVYFSVSLSSVTEVIESPEIIQVPIQEKGLLGILKYKDIPVPVIDPAETGKIRTSADIPTAKSIVLTESNDSRIGFVMDRFIRIIADTEQEEESSQESEEFVSGFSILEKIPLVILNEKAIAEHYKKIFRKQISIQKKNTEIAAVNVQSRSETEKFIFFSIGDVQFGVPIREVLEVLENVDVTPLFKTVPALRGVINVRGRVIACLDISSYIGMQMRSLNENTKFVILQNQGQEIALCVDSVSKMKEIGKSMIQTNEGLLTGQISEYASGILQMQKQTLLMISAENLIRSKDIRNYIGDEI